MNKMDDLKKIKTLNTVLCIYANRIYSFVFLSHFIVALYCTGYNILLSLIIGTSILISYYLLVLIMKKTSNSISAPFFISVDLHHLKDIIKDATNKIQ